MMSQFLSLCINETKLSLYEMKQYWFETVASIMMMTVVFLGLFFGIKTFLLTGDDTSSLDGLLFGYILWSFSTAAYSSVTSSIIEDNQKGFLEQLFLCPQGYTRLLMAKVFSAVSMGFVMMTILAYLAMALSGNWIELNFAKLFPLLLLTVPSVIGLGLFLGGLALVYKRVDTFVALMMLALMGLVAVPALPLNWASFLPLAPGASLARLVVLEQQELSFNDLSIVAVNSLVYLLIGILSFKHFERMAKRKNLIGQY